MLHQLIYQRHNHTGCTINNLPNSNLFLAVSPTQNCESLEMFPIHRDASFLLILFKLFLKSTSSSSTYYISPPEKTHLDSFLEVSRYLAKVPFRRPSVSENVTVRYLVNKYLRSLLLFIRAASLSFSIRLDCRLGSIARTFGMTCPGTNATRQFRTLNRQDHFFIVRSIEILHKIFVL